MYTNHPSKVRFFWPEIGRDGHEKIQNLILMLHKSKIHRKKSWPNKKINEIFFLN